MLAALPRESGITPSRIDHLIAVIRPDLTATVYVNECDVMMEARVARDIKAGEEVWEDDVIDISRLRFAGVEAPPEAAVVCLFSAGWRKGLFFDFAPLPPNAEPREYELESVLGAYYAYLENQTILSLTEQQWQRLFEERWFPFVTLPRRLSRVIVEGVGDGIPIESYLSRIRESIEAMEERLREHWRSTPLFADHLPLLEKALDRYLAEDYESSTAIVFPRIEGLLRSIHEALGGGPARAKSLAARVAERESHPYSWLLPSSFKSFLEEVYFANFEPGRPAALSRNSVGHGVARAEDFDLHSASLGILVVDQLWALAPSIET